MQATNLVPEGISIKHEELGNETAYQQWRIGNTATVEKYSIHVLQFDVFHKLLWFGTLTKGLMTAAAEPAELMDQFRREVKAAIKAYEKTEHSFLGSYVEK